MVKRNGTTIRGLSAKRKGSRAEIKVRNALRTIYPVELRNKVQRVPLSGAGSIKGDVYDANDWDSCYEVKCQETLCLNDWWRQAKAQALPARTPILVVTQAYRPFYFIMYKKDLEEMVAESDFSQLHKNVKFTSNRNFMDKAAELNNYEAGIITLDGDVCAVVSQIYYLDIKRNLKIK